MASRENKKPEDWMNSKWRPAMGWMYMVVCVFDFIVAPVLFTIVQFWETQAANDAFRQWQPMTLQGAGLFHMAMGAVLGIAAYGRTQEKMAGANNGGAPGAAPTPGFTPTAPSAPVFGSAPATPAPVFSPAPAPVFAPAATDDVALRGGRKAPVQPAFPEI